MFILNVFLLKRFCKRVCTLLIQLYITIMVVKHLFWHLFSRSLCISFECYPSVVCTCITFLFTLSLSLPLSSFRNHSCSGKAQKHRDSVHEQGFFSSRNTNCFLSLKGPEQFGSQWTPVRPALTHPHAFTLAWSNSGLSIHLKENFSVFQSVDKSLSVHARTMNVDSRERLRFCLGKFMLVHVRG